MRTSIYTKLLSLTALLFSVILLAACSVGNNTSSSQFGAREYYDYYSDRPGEHDFPRPVFFLPDDGPVDTPIELDIEN